MAKASKPTEQEGTSKTSFNLPTSMLNDLRYMVFKEKQTKPQASQTDIVIEAFKEYKEKWEKKNGKVPKS
jgi:hypothetical protein